jgi:hypothetical protein
MLGRRADRFDAVVAACLAVGLGFALLGSVALHTDDGCAVELHCFACHWSLASTGVVAHHAAPDPAPERLGNVILLESPLIVGTRAADHTSRGPPSA